jgi:enoyl-[acyl-carrier-protein] reductase (NADH)
VEPEDLGRFYASRTVLGREVLPEHVAGAVLALVAGDLERTTGTILPVDSGIPMAFLR